MEPEAAEDMRAILAHEEETAGGIMATACIETGPDRGGAATSSEQCGALADEVEIFNQIYVLDEARRLLGVLNLRELLLAPARGAASVA